MKTQKYFSLQLKKASKHYPAIIALNLVLIVCIALACILVIKQNVGSSDKQKIKIGVVGDMSNTYLDVGVTAVQNFDSSRFSVELVTHKNENEAKAALKSGETTGYLHIPSEFVSAVREMENIPLVYVTNNAPEGLGSILVNEMALTISSTVNETQRGIFALQKLIREYNKEGLRAHTNNINLEYIMSVLNRTNNYKTEYVGMADGLSSGGYFVCGGIMIFLLLWGISCSSILLKKDRALETLLISKGQSVTSQIFGEYFTFFILTFVTFLIFSALAGTVLQYTQIGINELDYRYISDFLKYTIAISPVLLMITSLQFLFYEMISGTVGVILSQFVFAIGTGYICGCLYPSHYFPVSIQKFAAVLPTGIGVKYMRQTLSESLSGMTFVGVMLYFVLFIGIAIAVRKHRNEGAII